MESRGKLTEISEARQRAALAFVSGLTIGDLLTHEEADEIREFRAYLASALAQRGLQLNEEPEGWRVARAPFVLDITARMHLTAVPG